MRTNEERLAAMHHRAAELERESRRRKAAVISVISLCVCFAVIFYLAKEINEISGTIVAENVSESMSGSIFAGSGFLGFLAVGIVAFLLGAAVTILCFRLKQWQELKDRDNT